jgi:hypothetical protein
MSEQVLSPELEAIVNQRVGRLWAEARAREQPQAAQANEGRGLPASCPPVAAPAAPPVMPPQPVQDFAFFDGNKVMHADRLAIYRKLMIATRGRPNELSNKVFAVKPDETDLQKLMESWEAAEQLVALVRQLFGMQPLNPATGQGARDEHCWVVWDAFCEAMDQDKKKVGTLPTSVSPTESPSASRQLTPNISA